jgi:CubicO group peptidase (beta-lactamase class C family)
MRSVHFEVLVFALVGMIGLSSAVHAAQARASTMETKALTDSEKDAFIQMAMRSGGIPGLQTVVVKDSRIMWMKSYGYAVLDQPGPATPMTNDSIFYTCSVSKIITAIAVMQQVERGRIALDDDINKFLPFPARNPKWPGVPITWRMLMTHSSSIDVDQSIEDSVYFYGVDSPISLQSYVEGALKPGGPQYQSRWFREKKPGTERIYSDIAVDLMGYALSRVVQEEFTSYVSHAIFAPLHMAEVSYSALNLPRSKLVVGYGRTEQAGGWQFTPNRVAFAHLSAGHTAIEEQMSSPDPPAGGLYASAGQFARLVMMLLNRGTLDGAKILEPSSVKQLATFSGLWSIYGYQQGLTIYAQRDLDDHLVWGHDGEDRGYVGAAFFDIDAGIGAIAFANANREDFLLSRRLVDLDLHMMDWFR